MTDDPSTGCPHLTPWSFLTRTQKLRSWGKEGKSRFLPWSSPRVSQWLQTPHQKPLAAWTTSKHSSPHPAGLDT